MTDYTFEDVRRTLHEVVLERPDYVYIPPDYADGQCVYGDAEGNPSCLWGHVVYRLDPEAFQQITGSISAVDALDWAQRFTPTQCGAMRQAQIEQDLGFTWGGAEAVFNDYLGTDCAAGS